MPKRRLFSVFLPGLLVIITICGFIWHVYGYRNDIFAKFDATYWTYRYNHSQWSSSIKCLVTDPHINPYTCVWDDNWFQVHPTILPQFKKISIGDDGLYAYAGYKYITGADPTQLNAELPPLGKYLVGFFEVTTGVMGAFSVFFGGVLLLLVFLFIKDIFKSPLLSAMTTAIFSLEPIFYEQLRAPYLDTLYFSAFLVTALLFVHKKYLLSGVALGLFMSIKSPFLGVLVILIYAVSLFLAKEKYLKNTFVVIAAAFVTYMLTYARVFFLGHGLFYILNVQKYIIHFYESGAKGVFGAVIPMLLVGKWFTWFSPVSFVTEWSIVWAIGFIGTFVGGFLLIRTKKKTVAMWLGILWIFGYMAFLVMTPVFPRYLLLVLPFMYNLSIWAFLKGISLKYPWVLPS